MTRFHTLIDVYEHAAREYVHHELFGYKENGQWRWLTYGQFFSKVEACRASYVDLGLSAKDKIALICNNRIEWAVLVYASFTMGMIHVPMYETQAPDEWQHILRDSGAKVLVVANEDILQKAKEFQSALPELTTIINVEPKTFRDDVVSYASLLKNEKKIPCAEVKKTDVACIIYTSGTTGNPKGVVLSHENLATNINAMHEAISTLASDRSLSFLPWAHVFGQTCEVFGLVALGASMALCEGPDKILQNLMETKPTLLFSVPKVFNRLYERVQSQISMQPPPIRLLVKSALSAHKKLANGGEPKWREKIAFFVADKLIFKKIRNRFGGRLKYAVSGSAALSKEVIEFIDALGITIYEGYGLTETSPIVSANRPSERRLGSVGRPIHDVDVEISQDGEILVYGPNVMQGYFGKKEETDAVLVFREKEPKRGIRTGDKGYLDSDGYLYITGRIKEQYKLENGKYVVPTWIEEQLKLCPYVLNVMVYGENKPFNVALIVPNQERLENWAKLNQIDPKNWIGLVRDAKVKELFHDQLIQYGGSLKGYERIKNFALIPEDFTVEGGLLTPKLSLKRQKIIEKYTEILSGMYFELGIDKRAYHIGEPF